MKTFSIEEVCEIWIWSAKKCEHMHSGIKDWWYHSDERHRHTDRTTHKLRWTNISLSLSLLHPLPLSLYSLLPVEDLVSWTRWKQRLHELLSICSHTGCPQNDLSRESNPFHVCLIVPDHESLFFRWPASIFCTCCNKKTTFKKIFERKSISQNDYKCKFDSLLLHLHHNLSLCQPHLFQFKSVTVQMSTDR